MMPLLLVEVSHKKCRVDTVASIGRTKEESSKAKKPDNRDVALSTAFDDGH